MYLTQRIYLFCINSVCFSICVVCLSIFASNCPSLAKTSSTTISLCWFFTCSISLCIISYCVTGVRSCCTGCVSSCFVIFSASCATGLSFHSFCNLPQPVLYFLCISDADKLPLDFYFLICSMSSNVRFVLGIFFCGYKFV